MLGIIGCGTIAPAGQAGASVTYVLVRHAEKGIDDARDPSLSEAGKNRAERLAELLANAPLTAAYSTAYQRTRQTAQPAADAHGIAVTTYDARMSPIEFVAQLRSAHSRGTILVVGHSNTVPDIVAALAGVAVEPMADDQFDRIYRITVAAGDRAILSQETY
jgi:broad specificity phosphatase PhoE